LSPGKYRVWQGAEKSGSKAAALRITSSQYYAGLSHVHAGSDIALFWVKHSFAVFLAETASSC